MEFRDHSSDRRSISWERFDKKTKTMDPRNQRFKKKRERKSREKKKVKEMFKDQYKNLFLISTELHNG